MGLLLMPLREPQTLSLVFSNFIIKKDHKMKEALIAQVIAVFCKAIKKFAKKNGYEENETSLLLRLDGGNVLEVIICHEGKPVKPTTPKDVMGMTLTFSGLGGIIIQYIEQILKGFVLSCGTSGIEVVVYLNREDDENVQFFLYADGILNKEFYLEEVLTI